MSGMSWDLEGVSEVLGKLDTSVRQVNTGVNNVLREGGTVLQKSIQKNTPTGDAQHGKHAKDDVQISSVRTQAQTSYKHILVGYGPATYWYMWFLEEGTYSKGNPKGIAPRKHVYKAFNSAQNQVQDVMARELSEVVRGVGE